MESRQIQEFVIVTYLNSREQCSVNSFMPSSLDRRTHKPASRDMVISRSRSLSAGDGLDFTPAIKLARPDCTFGMALPYPGMDVLDHCRIWFRTAVPEEKQQGIMIIEHDSIICCTTQSSNCNSKFLKYVVAKIATLKTRRMKMFLVISRRIPRASLQCRTRTTEMIAATVNKMVNARPMFRTILGSGKHSLKSVFCKTSLSGPINIMTTRTRGRPTSNILVILTICFIIFRT